MNNGQDPPKINTKHQRWKMRTELQAYKDSSRMLTINQMFPMLSDSTPRVKSNISSSGISQGFTSLLSPICGPVCKRASRRRDKGHMARWRDRNNPGKLMLNHRSPQTFPRFEKSFWSSGHPGTQPEREKAMGQLLCPQESKSHGFQPKSLANKSGHYHLCSRLKHIFVRWLLCEMEIIRLMLS